MLSWGNETVLNPLSFAKWYHLGPFWLWSEGDIIRNKKKKRSERCNAAGFEDGERRRRRGEPRNADSL